MYCTIKVYAVRLFKPFRKQNFMVTVYKLKIVSSADFSGQFKEMNRLSKTEFAIFISLIKSLLPKDLTNQNLSSLQLMLCRVAAVKRLPVHHDSADYIFWSFGIIEFNFRNLKIDFRLSRGVGGGSGGAMVLDKLPLPGRPTNLD